MKKNEKLILYIPLIVISLTFIVISLRGHINLNDINFDKLGGLGSFIGGLVGTFLTIVATLYIYKTYHSQKEELESQKTELILQRQLIAQQQFESTFFNMLNVHRELKNNLKLKHNETVFNFNEFYNSEEYRGIEVLEKIASEYRNLYTNLTVVSSELNTNLSNSLKKKIDNLTNDKKSKLIALELKGDKSNPKPELIELLEGKWDENNNLIESHKVKINFTFGLLFSNYQNILSHYCRNIYHILKFIRRKEEEDSFTTHKKEHYKQYSNILQSQLNVNEQFILFYNFIHFEKNDEKEIFHPLNLVNHYNFIDNIGVDNLIFKKHEEFYDFLIKGSDRKI